MLRVGLVIHSVTALEFTCAGVMKPKVFIGSSAEARQVVTSLQTALGNDVETTPWTDAFPLSGNTLDSLLRKFSESDFGVFVLAPDDSAIMREKDFKVARDNVLFEAGLFMGMHGKGRTFLVTPMGVPAFHVASDLLGFTTSPYDPERIKSDLRGAMTTVAAEIRLAIDEAAKKYRDLDFTADVQFGEGWTWPLKLLIRIRNGHSVPVALKSIAFDFAPGAPRAKNLTLKQQKFVPTFHLGYWKANGKEVESRNEGMFLDPGKETTIWTAFDPQLGRDKVQELHDRVALGVWRYHLDWQDDRGERRHAELVV